MKRLGVIFAICLMIFSSVLGCGSVKIKTAKDTRGFKVRVGYMSNYGSLWSIMTAIESNYMRDEGILVELVEFSDGPSIIEALRKDELDIGYIGQGAHKLCFDGSTKIFALSHISNADAIVVAPEINSMKDLEGEIVAYVEGTSSEEILKMALKDANMDEYDVLPIGTDVEDIVPAMEHSGIKAAAIWSPYSLEILEKVEGAKILADNLTFSDESIGLGSWITSDKFVKYNRRRLVHFTKALFKAMDYAADANYEETAEIVAKQLGSETEEVFKQRGDAEWLTGKEIVSGVKDGTILKYYKLQKEGFGKNGVNIEGVKVEDYVLFDIMLEAEDYR